MDERPIHKLTQEPVSDKFLDILERLKRGEKVNPSALNKVYEIRFAKACLFGRKPTIGIKGRKIIQDNVLKRLQKMGSAVIQDDGSVALTGEVRCDKRLDIIIGLPAAGKSSAVADPISERFKSRIIDCDEAKKMLPGYDGGWGTQAVHFESQKISNKQMEEALEKGENIAYPRVGAGYDVMEKVINNAKTFGYKVYVHYNELDHNKALGRMLERFLTTGRYLKPELITGDIGDKIDKTFEKLKSSGLLDGYSKWNNDVEFGKCPKPDFQNISPSCADVVDAVLKTNHPPITVKEKADELTVKEKADEHDAVVEKQEAKIDKLEADLAELNKELNDVKDNLNKAQAQLSKVSYIIKNLPQAFQKQFIQKRDELYPKKYDPARAPTIDMPIKMHKPSGGSSGSSGSRH